MLWLPETLSSAQAELPPEATEMENKVIYSECLHATVEPSGLVASSRGTGGDLETLLGLETPPGWRSPVQEGCSALPEGCCYAYNGVCGKREPELPEMLLGISSWCQGFACWNGNSH